MNPVHAPSRAESGRKDSWAPTRAVTAASAFERRGGRRAAERGGALQEYGVRVKIIHGRGAGVARKCTNAAHRGPANYPPVQGHSGRLNIQRAQHDFCTRRKDRNVQRCTELNSHVQFRAGLALSRELGSCSHALLG